LSAERTLVWLLRLVGTSSLLALVFVLVPYETMDSIHRWLGMGELPRVPVVGYLSRSLSGFYALLGGLLWLASFDLVRHRQVLLYLGAVSVAFGIALFAIDWVERLPLFWRVWEGPFVTTFGIVVFVLARKVPMPPGVDRRRSRESTARGA
jgi:hypothetical protein